jgi:allantoate deiminase
VTAITAIEQLECEITGRADHAGGCPMDARLDPMLAFAEMVLAATSEARRLGPPAVATVGGVRAFPGAPNTVAARVVFTLDVRYPELERHRAYVKSVREAFEALAGRHGLGLEIRRLLYQPPVTCSAALVETIQETAARLGIPCRQMVSGAGHDTQVLAHAGVPSAMIFVPSVAGRSHSPDEWTSLDDMLKGVRVLAHALHSLAY